MIAGLSLSAWALLFVAVGLGLVIEVRSFLRQRRLASRLETAPDRRPD